MSCKKCGGLTLEKHVGDVVADRICINCDNHTPQPHETLRKRVTELEGELQYTREALDFMTVGKMSKNPEEVSRIIREQRVRRKAGETQGEEETQDG